MASGSEVPFWIDLALLHPLALRGPTTAGASCLVPRVRVTRA
jgi:hypothetical protein